MIRRDLEGKVMSTKEDSLYYKEYLDSHRDIFRYYTVKCLCTPIYLIYSLGIDIPVENKEFYTLIDSYKNYTARGKLYEIMTKFWNYKINSSENKELLKTLLEGKGYNIETLIEGVIDKFIDSCMERVIYNLNQEGVSLLISEKYNMDILLDSLKGPYNLNKTLSK